MADLANVFRRWQAGCSPRRIAKDVGISRNTVRGYLRAIEAAGFKRDELLTPEAWKAAVQQQFPELHSPAARAVWWAELDRHREEIVAALAENRAAAVYLRMRDAGTIQASESTFRRYVRSVLPQSVDPNQVVVHGPQHAAGELAEVDYGRLGLWKDPRTGRTCVLNAFIMVMVFSRHLFVRPVLTMDKATWLECHVRAFSFFGGAPARLVLDYVARRIIQVMCPPLLCPGGAASPGLPRVSVRTSRRAAHNRHSEASHFKRASSDRQTGPP